MWVSAKWKCCFWKQIACSRQSLFDFQCFKNFCLISKRHNPNKKILFSCVTGSRKTIFDGCPRKIGRIILTCKPFNKFTCEREISHGSFADSLTLYWGGKKPLGLFTTLYLVLYLLDEFLLKHTQWQDKSKWGLVQTNRRRRAYLDT